MTKRLNDVFKGLPLTGQLNGIFEGALVEDVYMNKEKKQIICATPAR